MFKKRMGLKDLNGLQSEWYTHIARMDDTSVKGLEKAGVSGYYQGRRKFRATRLLGDAVKQGSTCPTGSCSSSRRATPSAASCA